MCLSTVQRQPDNAWVSGFTSNEVFDGLTPEQRQAILKTYGHGLPSHQVAKELGLTQSAVFKRRQRAANKVRENAEELNLIREDPE